MPSYSSRFAFVVPPYPSRLLLRPSPLSAPPYFIMIGDNTQCNFGPEYPWRTARAAAEVGRTLLSAKLSDYQNFRFDSPEHNNESALWPPFDAE